MDLKKENKMPGTSTNVIDLVCGMVIDPEAAIVIVHAGASYAFCETACAETFRDEPERWLAGSDKAPMGHAH